jgi:hypothetical protein
MAAQSTNAKIPGHQIKKGRRGEREKEIWRQLHREEPGRMETYRAENVSPDMSAGLGFYPFFAAFREPSA